MGIAEWALCIDKVRIAEIITKKIMKLSAGTSEAVHEDCHRLIDELNELKLYLAQDESR